MQFQMLILRFALISLLQNGFQVAKMTQVNVING